MAPGRPLLDLALQLVWIVGLLLPVRSYSWWRADSREPLSLFGLRTPLANGRQCRGRAVRRSGGIGLAGYLLAHELGSSLTVVPTSLPDTWWRIPALAPAAAANAVLEEVVVVGYLLRRLDQLGWPSMRRPCSAPGFVPLY